MSLKYTNKKKDTNFRIRPSSILTNEEYQWGLFYQFYRFHYEHFPRAEFQKVVTHSKTNIFPKVTRIYIYYIERLEEKNNRPENL